MADLVKRLTDYYDWTLTIADPRTKGWLLVDNLTPVFWLTVAYLSMVYFGPKIMKK